MGLGLSEGLGGTAQLGIADLRHWALPLDDCQEKCRYAEGQKWEQNEWRSLLGQRVGRESLTCLAATNAGDERQH